MQIHELHIWNGVAILRPFLSLQALTILVVNLLGVWPIGLTLKSISEMPSQNSYKCHELSSCLTRAARNHKSASLIQKVVTTCSGLILNVLGKLNPTSTKIGKWLTQRKGSDMLLTFRSCGRWRIIHNIQHPNATVCTKWISVEMNWHAPASSDKFHSTTIVFQNQPVRHVSIAAKQAKARWVAKSPWTIIISLKNVKVHATFHVCSIGHAKSVIRWNCSMWNQYCKALQSMEGALSWKDAH